jgi:hypothetical protein
MGNGGNGFGIEFNKRGDLLLQDPIPVKHIALRTSKKTATQTGSWPHAGCLWAAGAAAAHGLAPCCAARLPCAPNTGDVSGPGYLEADTVAHCGESFSAEFCWSLTMTGMHTQ